MDIAGFKKDVFSVTEAAFQRKALELFAFQAEENPVYKEFLHHLDISPGAVESIEQIPFLPVELFKSKKIITGDITIADCFESSGTAGQERSRHFVADLDLYRKSILQCFQLFYGPTSNYCFLFLLPSYLERKNASLVYMCNTLMQNGCLDGSGFYLKEYERLHEILASNQSKKIPTMLIGVSFALLDLAEKFPIKLTNTIIIETGGMKGRREEITRNELHAILKSSFGLNEIHSEYGMTELLSMAYSKGDGVFQSPPWMKILIRDAEDPFKILGYEKTGCINIIDLANIHSCGFIATQDIGKLHSEGSFEVLGRYDNTDIRGCNLMVE